MKENLFLLFFRNNRNSFPNNLVVFSDSIRQKWQRLLEKAPKPHSHPLATEQIKKLGEIGATLRKFREDRSICLERVSAVTMIREPLLIAIEEGQLDQLPEPVYTQGLIKRYADAMGLDGAELADSFPIHKTETVVQPSKVSFAGVQLRPFHLYFLYIVVILGSVNGLAYWMNRPQGSDTNIAASVPTVSPVPQPQATQKSESPKVTTPTAATLSNPSSVPTAATSKPSNNPSPDTGEKSPAPDESSFQLSELAAQVAATAATASPNAESNSDAAASNDNTTAPEPTEFQEAFPAELGEVIRQTVSSLPPELAASPASLKNPDQANLSPEKENSKTPGQPVQVSFTFKDESWVSIEVDGKTEFEGILPQGTQKTWEAKEKLVFVAGNAGAVLVTVNNGEAKQLGEPGAVKEVIFNANNPNPNNVENAPPNSTTPNQG